MHFSEEEISFREMSSRKNKSRILFFDASLCTSDTRFHLPLSRREVAALSNRYFGFVTSLDDRRSKLSVKTGRLNGFLTGKLKKWRCKRAKFSVED